MKVHINVTQGDIDAKGDSASTCPVARAAKRKFPKARDLWVGQLRINVTSQSGASRWIDLPMEAMNFVHDYDNGCAVSPFEFDITIDE